MRFFAFDGDCNRGLDGLVGGVVGLSTLVCFLTVIDEELSPQSA